MSEKSRVEKNPTLKALREGGVKPKPETLEKLKEQRQIRKKIVESLKDGAKTIPQIAEETSLPLPLVTWFVMSMFKYGEIEEAGEDGDYYLYRLAEVSEK